MKQNVIAYSKLLPQNLAGGIVENLWHVYSDPRIEPRTSRVRSRTANNNTKNASVLLLSWFWWWKDTTAVLWSQYYLARISRTVGLQCIISGVPVAFRSRGGGGGGTDTACLTWGEFTKTRHTKVSLTQWRTLGMSLYFHLITAKSCRGKIPYDKT
jgi:hypothetical protein